MNLHIVGRNRIQIYLRQMDRSELLGNQALLEYFLSGRTMDLAGPKKKKGSVDLDVIRFYKI